MIIVKDIVTFDIVIITPGYTIIIFRDIITYNIIVITTISKDSKSLLLTEMIEHYQSLGVIFLFLPLRAVGKAKSFSHLCPNLESDKQEELGAYYPFHQKNKEERGVSRNIVLIGNDYYMPAVKPWRKIGRLEHLPLKIIDTYKMN